MSEVSIPEPLSGSEVIDAVAYRVKEILQKDCFLSANSAYEKFECKITVELKLKDTGRLAIVEQTIEVTGGAPLEVNDDDVFLAQSEVEFAEAPPNVVRQETEQPVPVMTEDSAGHKERRTVKYKKRDRAAAAKEPALE